MRIVGYVREAPGAQEGEPAFAQAERIRRTVADGGHQLVAVCQDLRQPGVALGRDGFVALLGIVNGGHVDAVMVASLDALSPDVISQEVMMWDLRSREVAVLSASAEDVDQLADPPGSSTRRVVRDVLSRVTTYMGAIGMTTPVATAEPQVLIELVTDDADAEGSSGA